MTSSELWRCRMRRNERYSLLLIVSCASNPLSLFHPDLKVGAIETQYITTRSLTAMPSRGSNISLLLISYKHINPLDLLLSESARQLDKRMSLRQSPALLAYPP